MQYRTLPRFFALVQSFLLPILSDVPRRSMSCASMRVEQCLTWFFSKQALPQSTRHQLAPHKVPVCASALTPVLHTLFAIETEKKNEQNWCYSISVIVVDLVEIDLIPSDALQLQFLTDELVDCSL